MAHMVHASQLPCIIIEALHINRRTTSGGVLTERMM
jgi:hypothetical protein